MRGRQGGARRTPGALPGDAAPAPGVGVACLSVAARAFVGATAGYDFVVFRRLIIAPALGYRYGHFAPVTNVHTWALSPRIGFGLNFD